MSHESALRVRVSSLVKRLVSGVGVGGVATLVDLATLTLLVEALQLTPSQANLPALFVGASIQFLGCRHVVFEAKDGSLSRQFLAFAGVELVTLTLNALVFQALLGLSLPYVFARLVATFGVFMLFSFPAWHWVFRRRAATVA
ncbi:MAG: GtrA family protein [Deltaproteobacteria bacterium]|nr:GtrA family protein [Deltaproteobacteria bacterium]